MKICKCRDCGFVGVPEVRADDLRHLERCTRCGSASLERRYSTGGPDRERVGREIDAILRPARKKWWQFWKD
jgi:hypothetical protein